MIVLTPFDMGATTDIGMYDRGTYITIYKMNFNEAKADLPFEFHHYMKYKLFVMLIHKYSAIFCDLYFDNTVVLSVAI